MVILRSFSSPGDLYQRLDTDPWATSFTPYSSDSVPSIRNILVRLAMSLEANALLGSRVLNPSIEREYPYSSGSSFSVV
jgi:hypothetical protein